MDICVTNDGNIGNTWTYVLQMMAALVEDLSIGTTESVSCRLIKQFRTFLFLKE